MKGIYKTDPATRYLGEICLLHPELNGLRRISNNSCPPCVSARRTALARIGRDDPEKKAVWDKRREEGSARVRKWRLENPKEYKDMSKRNAALWAKNNPERKAISDKAWKSANRESIRITARKYRLNNIEKVKAWRVAAVLKNPPDRVKNSIACEVYRKKNPEKGAARAAKYRSIKVNSTPTWINDFFIQEAYDLAKLRKNNTGFDWHVDHIVPLNSELVCGLHCEHNLRVIPGKENLSKQNRYWPDMPALT